MTARSNNPGPSVLPLVMAILCAPVLAARPVHAQAVDSDRLRAWGIETYNEIDQTLRVRDGAGEKDSRLFAETASLDGKQSGGARGHSYVWPASTQFRVFDALTQIDPATYTPILRQFSDQLHRAYWNRGYTAEVGGRDRFYDDNAHLVVALVEAHRLTRDAAYLDRAKETQAFVMQGEDSAGGGGIYFQQGKRSSKDAISTLQAARGAAMLYRATGHQRYLDDAKRLLEWTRSHLQHADGLFSQKWDIAGSGAKGADLTNSAGIAISANLELYDATGAANYLSEAQRIARSTLGRYFDASTGRINDEGYWAFELVDALDDLYLHDHDPLWLGKAKTALSWLHDNKRDPNGHYGPFWGRHGPQTDALTSWTLNDQAAAARAYLYTSTVTEPPPAAETDKSHH